MTAYNLKPPTTLPTLAWQEAKVKRKHVLEAVRKRRWERYSLYLHKLQKRSLQVGDDLV